MKSIFKIAIVIIVMVLSLIYMMKQGYEIESQIHTTNKQIHIKNEQIKSLEIETENLKSLIQTMDNEYKKLASDKIKQVKHMRMEATAYTHTGNPTKTGVMPTVGMIAVDPNVIPLGSRVYVEGYGMALATDTGGNIKGHRIDLFMDTYNECIEYGRQHDVKVFVLN